MNRYAHDLILQTASDIVSHVDREYNTNVDLYSIVELIEINLSNELNGIGDYEDE